MSDEVKNIFKILIKVPLIILVAYLVLNAFAFAFVYFKLLGASYAVMQVAIENNYLPDREYKTLKKYIEDFDTNTDFLEHACVITSPDSDATHAAPGNNTSRKQYGATVVVGVSADYKMKWPLTYTQTIKEDGTVSKDQRTNKKTHKKHKKEDGTIEYVTIDGIEEGSVPGMNSGRSLEFKDDKQLEDDRETAATTEDSNGNQMFRFVYTVPGLKYYPDMSY